MRSKPILAIVVPCYNESEVLATTAERLFAVLLQLKQTRKVDPKSYLLFVDDGSRDDTWALIAAAKQRYKTVRGLKLTKNYGHQNALLAGLMKARQDSDCTISLDGDLQQDEKAIPEFLEKYREGNEIVYGVRKNRQADSWFKRISAEFFYALMQSMGARVIKNHADYRLVSRKALDALAQHDEAMLFLRGIFATLGFKSAVVYHEVKPRFAGTSKYNLRKMLSFALHGITSFSFTPIRFVSILGLVLILLPLLAGIVLVSLTFIGYEFSDRIWLLVAMYFLGGLQLTGLGVIGEYIGKVYVEVKHRPKYIVEEEL